ncbi:MAG TPA: sterol desaturase family protein [Burkholderiaceae bacterium]|jgi:sterol desaturase/sphingolipid hydroxylase (fatty acid hydroxylase superfamily)
METIILIAILAFSLLIAIEFAYGLAVNRNNYRLNDAISSLSQGALSQIASVFTQLFQIGIYTAVFSSITLFHHDEFWSHWYGYLIAVVAYDFCDYWLHRTSHEVAVFWAAHVVHHQSQEFNFTTALRQESLYPVLGFPFFLPLAVSGIPPSTFAIAGFVVLFYQFWIHTEHIGKLGWFDRFFSTPSNHRVHHAVNAQYVDKNYAAIFIIWDRMFGTFAEEKEKCVYGTIEPFNSWDPIWSVSHVFWKLLKDAIATRSWKDKLKIWFMPPGWKPHDLIVPIQHKTAPAEENPLYNPPMNQAMVWFACVHFIILFGALFLFLWYEDTLPTILLIGVATQIIAGLWVVGAVMQGRLKISQGLLLELFLLVSLSCGNYLLQSY